MPRSKPIRFSLRAKLYFSFACAVLALCSGVLISRYLSYQLDENLDTITGSVVPAIRGLGAIDTATKQIAEAVNTLWFASRLDALPSLTVDRERAEFFAARDQLRESKRKYFALITSSTKEYPYTQEIASLLNEFEKAAARLVTVAEGRSPKEEGEGLVERLEELSPKISLVLGFAAEIEASHLRERKAAAEKTIGGVVRFASVLFLVGIGLVGSLWVGMYGSLFRSILELREATAAVGSGKLDTRIENLGADELGSVGRSFNEMVAALEATTISRGFLQSVLASIVDGVIVTDLNGRIVNANDAFFRLSGFRNDDLRDRTVAECFPGFLPPEEVSSTDNERGRLMRSMNLMTKSGEPVPISMSAAPLIESNGRRSGWVIVARDIRSQQLAADELRRYREQLDHSQQLAAIGSMSALLAHKLNQPLTVIQLLLQQSLRDAGNPEVVIGKVTETLDEVKLISETLKEVLRFTRPTGIAPDESISLYEIAKKLTAAFEESAREASIEIDYSALEKLPSIRGIADEYEEIFFILIENAIHAATRSRPSKLSISAEQRDGAIELTFADTGNGIPEDLQEKIFELFFTTKPRHLGTGLGLGIVKQLVTSRGGKISVQSTLGIGASFVIRLPTARSPEEPENDEAELN